MNISTDLPPGVTGLGGQLLAMTCIPVTLSLSDTLRNDDLTRLVPRGVDGGVDNEAAGDEIVEPWSLLVSSSRSDFDAFDDLVRLARGDEGADMRV